MGPFKAYIYSNQISSNLTTLTLTTTENYDKVKELGLGDVILLKPNDYQELLSKRTNTTISLGENAGNGLFVTGTYESVKEVQKMMDRIKELKEDIASYKDQNNRLLKKLSDIRITANV
jgi:hypothetical protein